MVNSWEEALGFMLGAEDLSAKEENLLAEVASSGVLDKKAKKTIRKYFNSKGITLGCTTTSDDEAEFIDPDDIPLVIPIKKPEREPDRVPVPAKRR